MQDLIKKRAWQGGKYRGREDMNFMASRISTGDIFVEFGFELNFYCQCIKSYSVYCND